MGEGSLPSVPLYTRWGRSPCRSAFFDVGNRGSGRKEAMMACTPREQVLWQARAVTEA